MMRPSTVFRRLRLETRGNVLLIFAILLPLLMITVATAVDYANIYSAQSSTQEAADKAALAAAQELTLVQANPETVQSVATNYAREMLAMAGLGGDSGEPVVAVNIAKNMMAIEMSITRKVPLYFGGIIGRQVQDIEARSVALLPGRTPICLLGLSRDDPNTLSFANKAQLSAEGCAIFSNSVHKDGLGAKDNAAITADFICTAGGKMGSTIAFNPKPVLDCPQIDDPLAKRALEDAKGCDYTNLKVIAKSVTLKPGVYCGGLQGHLGARITLEQGIHIFKNGPVIMTTGTRLTGEYTNLYFTGDNANLYFGMLTTIDLTAPKDGPMAGILMFQDPATDEYEASGNEVDDEDDGTAQNRPRDGVYRIESNNARNLLGTIYLPRGKLLIDSTKPVADASAYTVIVVKQLDLRDGPNLVLNNDYNSTDVPVPDGLGPSTGPVFLGTN